MLEVQIYKMLREIVDLTYPDKNISNFWIEVHPKEMRRHGDYSPLHRKIRIFNLSQKTEYIISTALHELAHHCEYCIYGSTGHSARFYKVFKEIIETAVKTGIVSYEEIRLQSDANDIAMLEKHHGRVTVKYDPTMDKRKDIYMIKVKNSFKIKEQLKNMDFKYNSIEQVWYKEVHKENIDNYKEALLRLIEKENIVISSMKDNEIEAIYYVVVDNCYDYKDSLKEKGYRYKGYNFKGNVWVKKIKAQDLNMEMNYLNRLKGIKVKVKGKK